MLNQTNTPAKLEALIYAASENDQLSYVNFAYIGNDTAEKIQARITELESKGHMGVRAVTWDEWEALELENLMATYNFNKATRIDAELFSDRLNVLPPCRWNPGYDFESFYVSEAITGNMYSFYVRIKMGVNNYFEVNADRSITDSELSKLCMACMDAEKVATAV